MNTRPMSPISQELEILETFLRETPEEGIRESAQYIFERVKINLDKLRHSPDPALMARFGTVLSEVEGYLFPAQQPTNSQAENFSSANYWEERYAKAGNSGAGSYGRLARFKAEVLNEFVATHKVRSVIEFGHGDGNQLVLAKYPQYLGFDVSETAVTICENKFSEDKTKEFRLMNDYRGEKAEVTLSLDVIYHLIEDGVFESYMKTLFAASTKYVIVYASNKTNEQWVKHVKHRKFTDWVEKNEKDFKLLQFIPNKYPATDNSDNPNASFADFYIFGHKVALDQIPTPLVSILVPVYNTEQYLRQHLDSIINQTYRNIEVICVNDCSPDNSSAILQEYAQIDKRIIVINKSANEGLPQARKTAFAHSSGHYILPVDSDDWLEPNMVEQLYNQAAFGDYDIICAGYLQEKRDGTHLDAPQILPEDKVGRIKHGIFGFGNTKVVWNKLVKRKIYEQIEFGKESNGEDCFITCQNLYYADKVGYCPLYLYHWRYSEHSLTADKSMAQKRYEERKINYSHIVEFCKDKFGNDLSAFEPELSIRMADLESQNVSPADKDNFVIARMIDVNVPVTTCNFRCHYCYITQQRQFSNKLPQFTHTPRQMAQAFSKKRLGGACILNLCADGETLLMPEMAEIIKVLLSEGHILMVVTNGSMSSCFDEFVKFPQELRNRLFIKFSFHYLELLRLKRLDRFFANLQKMKDNGISFTLEITPCDELIPHIEDIKKICLEKAGALPHFTVGRDNADPRLPILTRLSRDEYKKTWSQFNSPLFDFKLSVFNVKQTDFCYGGQATYSTSLDHGILKQCYREKTLMNLYEDVNQPIKVEPVGCNCSAPHCWNAHVWMGLGTVPAKNDHIPLYLEMRNRICADGSEWIVGDVKKAFSARLKIKAPASMESSARKGVILVYHKLAEDHHDNLTVDLQTFEDQMMYLRHKKVVFLDDYDRANPDHVVIRLDDGDRRSVYYAMRVLKKLNYPFEVFVCGRYWGKDGKIGSDDVPVILKNGGRLQYHTNTHPFSMTAMSESELEREFRVPEVLKNIGNNCFNWLAYPYWKWNDAIKRVAKEHFRGALSGNGFADDSQYAMDSVKIDNDSDFAEMFGEQDFSAEILQKVQELRRVVFQSLAPLIKDENYWLLEIPFYSNIGDVLIWAGEEYFLNEAGKGRCLYRTSADNFAHKPIQDETVIFLQGGGNFGDLWEKPQSFRKRIISSYPNNRIVIFPQTIFYEDENKLQADAQVFNRHKNLTICARDDVSFGLFKKHFNANILLVPDMAFCIPPQSLLEYRHPGTGKKLFVRRKDKELNPAYDYSELERQCDTTDWSAVNNLGLVFLREFLQLDKKTGGQITDFVDFYANSTFKDYMIKEGVELLSKYAKIYTTRLHCAILSCLLGKPATLLDNSYGKNRQFFETWLKNTEGISYLPPTFKA